MHHIDRMSLQLVVAESGALHSIALILAKFTNKSEGLLWTKTESEIIVLCTEFCECINELDQVEFGIAAQILRAINTCLN